MSETAVSEDEIAAGAAAARRNAGLARKIAPFIVFAAVFLAGLGSLDGPWKIDEPQRIQETYYLRLVERGAFHDPDWFRYSTQTSHPPFNKYVMGVLIQAQGETLPEDLGLLRYFDTAKNFTSLPPEFERVYAPLRKPARRGVLLMNAMTAALIAWLSLEMFGWVAAFVAMVLFLRHFVTGMLMTNAVSDPLEALMITATAVPLWLLWRDRERSKVRVVLAAGAGILSAGAFQTRLNGLLAIGAVFLVLAGRGWSKRSWRPLGLFAVSFAVFVTVSTVINPFYWARAPIASGVPSEFMASLSVPSRIADRYTAQIRNIRGELLGVDREWQLDTISERFLFVFSTLFSGKAGKGILVGLIFFVVFGWRGYASSPSFFLLLWGGGIIVAFSIWLPLAWSKYVILAVVPAVLIAAAGWAGLVSRVRHRWAVA